MKKAIFYQLSIVTILCIIISPPFISAQEQTEKINVCVDCHQNLEDTLKDAVTNWQESVHKKAGVYCNDCHGGDPNDSDNAMDEKTGFIGIPKPKDIPKICSRCHSDVTMMRKYNLKTDQFNLYKTSIHGIRLFEKGDESVATCASCHGNHNVLSKNDPRSPIYRFNVPLTCGKCHSNKEMMKPYNIPTDQYELYSKSHHGKMLFENKNLRVPTCVDCHGTHGAVPPSVTDIVEVCSNCHSVISEYFKKSPHQLIKKEGMPRCINCHGNHDIQRPTLEKFTGKGVIDCGGCHYPESPAFKTGADIKAVLIEAEILLKDGNNDIALMKEKGGNSFAIGHLEDDMDNARTKLLEAYSVSHTLSIDEIKRRTSEVVSISKNVSETIKGMIKDIKLRKLGLIFTWVVIGVIIILLRQKAKNWKRVIK